MEFLVAGAVLLIILLIAVFNGSADDAVNKSQLNLPTTKPSQRTQLSHETARPTVDDLSTLLPQQFIVLDLETTGLSPYTDEIIEIGAIKFTLGRDEQPAFQALVKPTCKLLRKIVEITRITDAMLDADGIAIQDALRKFVEFAGDLPIVTYNAEFDMGFLHNAAKRCGMSITNRYACALKRARRAWPELPNHKLAYMAEIIGASANNQHRALADAQRTIAVFCVCTAKLGKKVRWTKPATA